MAALHVEPNFNPEEAAHAAAEFVSTLDNLPGEVAFLLEEIRDRDERINDLLDRINVRHTSLTKHARTSIQKAEAAAASSSASASTPFPLPIPAGSPFPTSHLSTKEAQAVAKIMGEFDKVQMLQDEKVELAQRMERIVLRAKERGRAEWARVGGKDIVEVEKEEAAASNIGGRASKGGTPGLGAGDGAVGVPSGGLGGDRPQKKRKPNLSLGASMPPPPAPVRHPPLSTANSFLSSAHNTPVSSSHGPGARKRERERERERESRSVAASDADADGESEDYVSYGSAAGGSASAGAYGITGPMSSHGSGFSAGVHVGHGQGHAGRKGFTVTHPPPANEDVDMDADGEADADGEPDDRLYCICQQKSYGEMIGCDNDECPYEWFHVECVNITGALPKTWYCPDCIKLLGFTGPAHTPSASDTRAGGRTKKGRKSRG